MSSTTLRFSFIVDGAPTDATAVVLRDPTLAYGVKRVDTGATVVAAGAAMNHTGTGKYEYAFTDPAAGLTYNYWVEATYAGATYRFERNLSTAPISASTPSYLSVDEANALADALPGLATWKASTADAKAAALAGATQEVDDAMPYQGRRYVADQPLAFPRVSDDSGAAEAAEIWDWDSAGAAAVTPMDVRRAVLHQADSILDGSRSDRIDRQHDGVVYDLTGTLAESYKSTSGPGVATGLCRAAYVLMRKYRLRSGRLV